MADPFAAVVVGCKRGGHVAQHLADLTDYRLVGMCDLDLALAEQSAANIPGAHAYTDFARMLAELHPDVVYIATNTQPRAALTIAAAQADVKGIIAEKPMAMSMGEARAMAEACARHGARLIVTHQRRMGSDLAELRALIAEGAIGDLQIIRVGCAGDLLTDGTHAIDSALFLAGDRPARWLVGQIFRLTPDDPRFAQGEFAKFTGTRYGHPVESGAMAIIQLADQLRVELFTGRCQAPGGLYQEYEIVGTRGILRRLGDRGTLRILDEQPGGWRDLPIRPENARQEAMREAWITFADYLRTGGDHPLAADRALAVHEIVMGIYESARLGTRLDLPLQQNDFPLQLIIDRQVAAAAQPARRAKRAAPRPAARRAPPKPKARSQPKAAPRKPARPKKPARSAPRQTATRRSKRR